MEYKKYSACHPSAVIPPPYMLALPIWQPFDLCPYYMQIIDTLLPCLSLVSVPLYMQKINTFDKPLHEV